MQPCRRSFSNVIPRIIWSAKPIARIRWALELIGPKHGETGLRRGAQADLYLLESARESVL
jgi:hypothetical protein